MVLVQTHCVPDKPSIQSGPDIKRLPNNSKSRKRPTKKFPNTYPSLLVPSFLVIPHHAHGYRERPHGAPVLAHVYVESARPCHLFQLALWAGGPAQVGLAEQHAEHLRQRNLARRPAEASMRADAVVDVLV